ncbi:DUF4294 domain-containing protein [Flavobacterium agricola]|uniref:DUF4294 domain-containing protein n=2 Tax=Flavobacterium agricola TaxID=2870839 RepID=A0ABY6M3X9_9FLAO|nr:DUF4294 domain-containing protein [Flavobacterium agricola]
MFAQINIQTNLPVKQVEDSVVLNYQLNELVIGKYKTEETELMKLRRLENRILRVYPYAKAAADNLKELNQNLEVLESSRDQKKYFKLVEKYLEDEFKPRLKKLSRQDGQILIKLIHRQTGETTFDLVKNLKSGWSAFWSNNTAKVFDLNLKKEYLPYEDIEDFYIETILQEKFKTRRLPRQEAALPIDFDDLTQVWHNRLEVEK